MHTSIVEDKDSGTKSFFVSGIIAMTIVLCFCVAASTIMLFVFYINIKVQQKTDIGESCIMNHAWWKKPITRETMDNIITHLCNMRLGDGIYVEDTGLLCSVDTFNERIKEYNDTGGNRPRILRFIMDGRLHRRRVNTLEAKAWLAAMLDSADFKDCR